MLCTHSCSQQQYSTVIHTITKTARSSKDTSLKNASRLLKSTISATSCSDNPTELTTKAQRQQCIGLRQFWKMPISVQSGVQFWYILKKSISVVNLEKRNVKNTYSRTLVFYWHCQIWRTQRCASNSPEPCGLLYTESKKNPPLPPEVI